MSENEVRETVLVANKIGELQKVLNDELLKAAQLGLRVEIRNPQMVGGEAPGGTLYKPWSALAITITEVLL